MGREADRSLYSNSTCYLYLLLSYLVLDYLQIEQNRFLKIDILEIEIQIYCKFKLFNYLTYLSWLAETSQLYSLTLIIQISFSKEHTK